MNLEKLNFVKSLIQLLGIMHMYIAHKRNEKAKERGYFAYKVEGFGELRFYPIKDSD